MKARKPLSRRRVRRQRLALQLAAALGVSLGSSALAKDDGYFAPHPSEVTEFRLSDRDSFVTTQPPAVVAPQNQIEVDSTEPPVPVADPQTEAGDGFLADDASPVPETQDKEAEASIDEDVQSIVEGSQSPVPPSNFPNSSGFNSSAFRLGATAGTPSAVPGMIGDHFGGLFLVGSMFGVTVALGGGDRRFKVAENVSPIPTDRVFFNYNHFENALTDANGLDKSLDRFTFGFEKTFLDGLASFEMRAPFARGLDSTQTINDFDTRGVEFGNLAFALKANLISGDNWMLSGGASMTAPTGDDYQLNFAPGASLRVKNQAFHLAPFLGYLSVHDRWFVQGFLQADFDLNGNDVVSFGAFDGTLQDQNLLFADLSVGHWLYRNRGRCCHLNAVAAIAELHYTSTLNDTDNVAGVFNPHNRMDILNATAALTFHVRQTTLRVGGSAPLRSDEEQLFDAEIIFQLNRFF